MTPANGIKAIWTSMCINSQKINYFTNPPKTDLCVHSEVDYTVNQLSKGLAYDVKQCDGPVILRKTGVLVWFVNENYYTAFEVTRIVTGGQTVIEQLRYDYK